MGKLLVVKNADFSSVAVAVVTPGGDTPSGDIVYYDFINFDGASYVETNVKTKANTKVETAGIVTAWTASLQGAHLLGTRSGGLTQSNDKFTFQIAVTSVSGVSASIGNSNGYINTNINATLGTKYTFVADSSTLVINGTSKPVGSTITPGTYPFILGNTNEGGSPLTGGQALTGKLYETKFYEGETLVADFKPCTKDGVAGFYDTVGGQFYGNSGIGTLTAGND